MYLEVSPRRSGKTTRLRDDLIEYIDITDNLVYLVTISPIVRNTIFNDYIPSEYHNYILHLPIATQYINLSYKLYVDEVDHCTSLSYFPQNAYYCGTPGIEGYLKRLVKANGCKYEKFMHEMTEEDIVQCSLNMGHTNFNREILGKFE